ncbi:MAG: tRNA 2-thiocytidine biosynthesis protein TtcA [Oscillospiraceae bacterium]|jgi:tRNA(Ile)-lysidine synthase TilS/MesJ|nr:tRNA 2-thiocytidine biosynthesis protein TtcA [Oscillospiraceae bacterium]
MESIKDTIERSIFKSHRKELWTPFLHAIQDYKLIDEGDRIAVCVSGGKDSWLLASLFQALARVTAVPFEARYICMDPGYPAFERACVEETATRLGVDLHVFETDVFEQVRSVAKGQCYLCARMRRGHLYKEAQNLGCNKIALAHHYNDVVETILMGMLYGAQVQTMMPKLAAKNFPGMRLIRPLYYVREKDIIAFRDRHEVKAIRCGCPLLESCDTRERTAKARGRTKALIEELKKVHPTVEDCIFRSVQNVNLNTIIGYHL